MNLGQLIGQLRMEAGFYGPAYDKPQQQKLRVVPDGRTLRHSIEDLETPNVITHEMPPEPKAGRAPGYTSTLAGKRTGICGDIRRFCKANPGETFSVSEIAAAINVGSNKVATNIAHVRELERSGTRGKYRYGAT